MGCWKEEELTHYEIESFEMETRRLDREEKYEGNIAICLKCERGYDSGTSGRYSMAANFCGICIIEASKK